MQILITKAELIRRGLWDQVLEVSTPVTKDMAMHENLIFTEQEAKQLGLIALTQAEKWDLEEKW